MDCIESHLKQQLKEKINTIKESNKTPVVFFLIGTYPGYSQIHQTPPYICDIINDDNLAPIVILFDSMYEENNIPLTFLVKKHETLEPGTWYYPHYIKSLNNSYQGKVAYQYYPMNVTEQLMQELLTLVSPNITLLWSFTSITFCKNFNQPCHITEGNCMANLNFQSEYFPVIRFENNKYYIENNDISLNTIVDEIIKLHPFKLDIDNFSSSKLEYFSKLEKLYGFVYYYIMKWLEEFQIYKTWEIQIRLYDPTYKIKLTKDSTPEEWNHFKFRVGPYFDVDKMINKFSLSDIYTLEDFISNSIFENASQLIKLDAIDIPESDKQFQFSSFYDEYEKLIESKSNKMASIFSNYLSKFHTKYSR
jgi:hypothetical protein